MKKITRNDKVIIDQFNGVSDLVFCGFRYFLGRRTIATSAFAKDLAKIYPLLEGSIKAMIRKELEAAYEQEKRSPEWKPLGDACDREAWDKVRKVYLIDPVEETE
jgi:hypothetical protein